MLPQCKGYFSTTWIPNFHLLFNETSGLHTTSSKALSPQPSASFYVINFSPNSYSSLSESMILISTLEWSDEFRTVFLPYQITPRLFHNYLSYNTYTRSKIIISSKNLPSANFKWLMSLPLLEITHGISASLTPSTVTVCIHNTPVICSILCISAYLGPCRICIASQGPLSARQTFSFLVTSHAMHCQSD